MFVLDLRLVEIRQVYVHLGVGLHKFVDQKLEFWIPRALANMGDSLTGRSLRPGASRRRQSLVSAGTERMLAC